jgi:phosphopantothenoylcysteine decarboxylase/phosphopantothenate--cysteine ligase
MRVLLTSGATREPIDSIRYISNISTGKTGALIADELHQKGIEIHLVCGQGSVRPIREVQMTEFVSFTDLNEILRLELGHSNYDAVIHAAAVSDFSVLNPHSGKISSDQDHLSVQLVRNFKIVEKLKDYSKGPKNPQIIAFKLTATSDSQERMRAIQRLSFHPKIDYVVHNDLTEIKSEESHTFTIFSQDQRVSQGGTKKELAENLFALITRPRERSS